MYRLSVGRDKRLTCTDRPRVLGHAPGAQSAQTAPIQFLGIHRPTPSQTPLWSTIGPHFWRPRRLAWSRTPPFHGGNMGSNPIGVIDRLRQQWTRAVTVGLYATCAIGPAAVVIARPPWTDAVCVGFCVSLASVGVAVKAAKFRSRAIKECRSATEGELPSHSHTSASGNRSASSDRREARRLCSGFGPTAAHRCAS